MGSEAMVFDLDGYLADLRERVNAALAARLPPAPAHDHLRLHEAMAAALLGGGKRLRPCLLVAACQAVGGTVEQALGAACAVELVHAYSLVHDDLPAMDNDATRRGQPTCHQRFGQTTAILAGDALLTLAFEVLAEEGLGSQPARQLAAAGELGRAAGARGMVGGQAMDMALKSGEPDFHQLELCQAGKTAALFSASTAMGGIVGGADAAQVDQLRGLGFDLGLAFQHADDLADQEFVRHRDRARQRALDLSCRAGRTAERLGEPGAALAALARWVEQRARDAGTTRAPLRS